jgi:HAD superfamily hydrolase (TIGR01450 family)
VDDRSCRPFVVCCDLDGVVWRGDVPIEPAVAGIAELRTAGVRVTFVTNNSSQRVVDVVAKLDAAGVPTDPDDVVTSAEAAGALLTATLAPGSKVLVCAGPGVVDAMCTAGFEVVDRAPAAAVVVGFHREFDFDELVRASQAVRDGAHFVATNLDPTYPVADGGLLPGGGAIAAAVATASGRQPVVAGKPEAPMVAIVRERFGPAGVVIGDRPSSDGAFADALGWPFALVLSGVAARMPQRGEEPIPDPPPPFVGSDLGALVPVLLRAAAATAGA